MIQFNMRRFLSVARWDMTVNKRFYISQACAIMVLALLPVLLGYLYWWSQGYISFLGVRPGEEEILRGCQHDYAYAMAVIYSSVGNLLPLFGLGYMFHNLATRQGRTAELTLPASNAERFLWHALFSIVAPLLMFACSVLLAELLQLLLAVVFRCTSGVTSYILAYSVSAREAGRQLFMLDNASLLTACLCLSSFCYVSTFALGNAWKYRYNIIYTILAHMFFWIGIFILLMFLVGILSQMSWLGRLVDGLAFFQDFSAETIIYTAEILWLLFSLALLAGIWGLTYRLYCRAQITSRRNK